MKKERIVLPISSFIAFADFNEETKIFEFCVRASGKKYAAKITKTLFREFKRANNKGSFISVYIITKLQCDFVELVPLATVEEITLPQTKFYKNLAI